MVAEGSVKKEEEVIHRKRLPVLPVSNESVKQKELENDRS